MRGRRRPRKPCGSAIRRARSCRTRSWSRWSWGSFGAVCRRDVQFPRDAFSARPETPSRRASSRSTSAGPRPCRASSTRQWNHRSATSATRRILSPSIAASSVSVASSPILRSTRSSGAASNDATYDAAGSAALRDSMTAAIRASTSASSVAAIDGGRILEDRLHGLPLVAFEPPVEAALAAGMAGDAAHLLDDQQDRVAIAIEADLAHPLHVARLLALAPQLVPRARPVVCLARVAGERQCVTVHPRERQHAMRRGVLSDRGREAVLVPANLLEPAVVVSH